MRPRVGTVRGRTATVAAGTAVVLIAALAWPTGAAGGRERTVPLGLGAVPVPQDNPVTVAKIVLGERLFFDRRLSADGSVSCASCHRPDRFFADDVPLSTGIAGKLGDRNAPSLLNAAYAPRLMRDGRSPSLEDQVRYPITHAREMNTSERAVVAFLSAEPSYAGYFARAFGDSAITWERVAQAIASFERTLLTGNSPFDRFMAGDKRALSESAQRGFDLFRKDAGCAECHHYSAERPFFSDFDFHNSGVGWQSSPDLGRYEVTKAREDKGAFLTPSLRNVAKTGPYMHDGRLATLVEVLDHYARGGETNPFLDARIRPLSLTIAERADLIAFLESLTGETTYHPRLNGSTAARVEVIAGSIDVGDRGPAIHASFITVGGLAVDRSRSVYVADSGGERVRKIDARGAISTVAGTGLLSGEEDEANRGLNGPAPLAIDPSGRYLFVGEIIGRRVKRVDLEAGTMIDLGTPPGGFGKPAGLAWGPSGLLVVDSPRGQLWRLQADDTWKAVLPDGIRLRGGIRSAIEHPSGSIYIAEYFAHRVVRWDPVAGRVEPVAGTGEAGRVADGAQATRSPLRTPDGLALDALGNLLIADKGNRRICRIDGETGRLTTLLSAGPQGAPTRWTPGPIAVDPDGTLWIGDIHRNRLLRYRAGTKSPVVVAGDGDIGDGGPALAARFAHPGAVAVDAANNVYVSDTLHHRVRVVDAASHRVRTIAGTGIPGYNGDGIPAMRAWLGYPARLQVDDHGNVYIGDYYNNRVRRVDAATGLISTVAGSGVAGEDETEGPAERAPLINPHALLLRPDRSLIVVSAVSSKLHAVDLERRRLSPVPLPRGLPETLVFYGVAAWRDGLVLASPRPGSIEFLKDGRLSTLWRAPEIVFPQDVAVSPEGELFICETGRNRIVKWDGTTLTVVAANLGRPRAICFDRTGALLVADTFNNRVLRVHRGR